MSTFSFSYAYKALDEFSPTAKAIQKVVRSLNKDLEKTALVMTKVSVRSRGMGRSLSNSMNKINPLLLQSSNNMQLLAMAVDRTAQAVADLKASTKGGINVHGRVTGFGQGAEGGGGERKSSKKGLHMPGFFRGVPSMIGTMAAFGGAAHAVTVYKDYEEALREVRKVTGYTASEMEVLKEASYRTGRQFGMTANDALMASAKITAFVGDMPVAELNEMTKASIILARAGGVEVVEAANAMSIALGQYGTTAKDATKFTNIMAAASSLGGSEIKNTMEAITVSGGIAHNAGMSFELLNAMLQGIAKGGSLSRKAGTGLGGIVQNLEVFTAKKGIRLKDVGIVKVLEYFKNLKPSAANDEMITKVIGKEHKKTFLLLLQHLDTIKRYEKGVSGTNRALVMAMVGAQDLGFALNVVGSTMDNKMTKVIDRMKDSLIKISASFATWMDGIDDKKLDRVAKSLSIMATGLYLIARITGKVLSAPVDAIDAMAEQAANFSVSVDKSSKLGAFARYNPLNAMYMMGEAAIGGAERIFTGAYNDKTTTNSAMDLMELIKPTQPQNSVVEVKVSADKGSTASVTSSSKGLKLNTGTNVATKGQL